MFVLDLPQTITATRLIARGCDPATAIRMAACSTPDMKGATP